MFREWPEDVKRFSIQFRECREDGTAFDEMCFGCGRKLIMCRRFHGQCQSTKCRDWRIKQAEEENENKTREY